MDVQSLITALQGNSEKFDHILGEFRNGLSSEISELLASPHIKETLHTLAEVNSEVIDFRLKKILSEEHPYIPQIQISKLRFNEINDPAAVCRAIDTFLAQRREFVKILAVLPGSNWERTGVHETEGHVTFKEFVRRMIDKESKALMLLTDVLPASKT